MVAVSQERETAAFSATAVKVSSRRSASVAFWRVLAERWASAAWESGRSPDVTEGRHPLGGCGRSSDVQPAASSALLTHAWRLTPFQGLYSSEHRQRQSGAESGNRSSLLQLSLVIIRIISYGWNPVFARWKFGNGGTLYG